MTEKAKRTRKRILEKSQELFVEHGYKTVTMKDICEATGLSRGGLYRHFSSTEEILQCLLEVEQRVSTQIEKGLSAKDILEEELAVCRQEMLNGKNNMGLAIYEYSSVAPPHFFEEGNMRETSRWRELICYGIGTGEFKNVDVNKTADMILYSYLGTRMWARMINMRTETIDNIIGCIRDMLLPTEME